MGTSRKKKEEYINFSDRIFDTPEILYQEFKSVSEHIKMLKMEGFKITENICNMPTAVMGEYGEDGPIIAILGEFDALPGLSQEAGITKQKPLENTKNGHGCGHNLLGAASLLAATAIKDWLFKNKIKGKIGTFSFKNGKVIQELNIYKTSNKKFVKF